MTTPLQPTDRRLLTEHAAGVHFADPATPLGSAAAALAADIRDEFVPLTQRAAAGGVATLGADGKVPPAQLPPGSTAVTAVKTSDTSRVNTATRSNDPHLTVSGLTVDALYDLELGLMVTGMNVAGHFGAGAGAPAPILVNDAVVMNSNGSAFLNSNGFTAGYTGTAVPLLTRVKGLLRPTAASLTFVWAQNAAHGNAAVLKLGSYLRVERRA